MVTYRSLSREHRSEIYTFDTKGGVCALAIRNYYSDLNLPLQHLTIGKTVCGSLLPVIRRKSGTTSGDPVITGEKDYSLNRGSG